MKGVSKTKHQHPLSWYVKEYGLALKTIVNYHHRKPNPWPLDDPRELLRLILQLPGQKPNLTKLQKVALAAPRTSKVQESPPPPIEPLLPKESVKEDDLDERSDLETPGLVGAIAHQVKFLSQEAERAKKDYLREKRPADKAAKFRILQGILQTLHKFQKTAPADELASGNALQKSEVDAAWYRTLKEMRIQLDALPRRLATHPAFKTLDPVRVEEIVRTEKDQILEQLHQGYWIK